MQSNLKPTDMQWIEDDEWDWMSVGSHVYERQADNSYHPYKPEIHTQETVRDFLALYNTKKVNMHLELV